MNKHVESLPKVDNSITFHYCTVMCDLLRPIDVIFLYMIFCVSSFFKSGHICDFQWTSKSQKCFSLRGASPPWPRVLPLLSALGSTPGFPII